MELFGWVNKFVRGCCRLRGGLRVVVAPKKMIFRYGISENGGVLRAIMAPFCGVLGPGGAGVGRTPYGTVWMCKRVS
jgi:hypothetical protein